MTGSGSLVDLSLFATPPSDDRRFRASTIPFTDRRRHDVSCYRAQRQLNGSQEGNYLMKSLPPLPGRTFCARRPRARRSEAGSRCILDRIKGIRTHDPRGEQRPTPQQRRLHTAPPLWTLSPPASSHESRRERAERRQMVSRPTMIWMPEHQMWLVHDRPGVSGDHDLWWYIAPANHAEYRYTGAEPSGESAALLDNPPVSPTHSGHMDHTESPDPIRTQFLRLMQPEEDEMLSSRFQEAIQSVPPMTPHPTYTIDEHWEPLWSNDDEEDSYPDSFQIAHAAPGEDSRSVYSRLSLHNPRSYPEEDWRSVFAQISQQNPWDSVEEDDFANRSLVHEYENIISPMTREPTWRVSSPSVVSPLLGNTPWIPTANLVQPRAATV